MRLRPSIASLAVLGIVLPVLAAPTAWAQNGESEPHLPSAPQSRLPGTALPSGPLGIIGSADYLVTSSANEHGSYLWIVGPAQHIVILCEKTDAGRDFACNTKRLP